MRAAELPRVEVRQLERDPELVGKELVVEGRVDAVGLDRMRLKRCRVDFRFDGARPSLPFRASNVALTGTLQRPQERLIFRIAQIQALPSDEEVFQRRYRLALGDEGRLYELGRWAAERADFYDDKTLRELAQQAFQQGVRAEEEALRPGDTDGLLDLAERARRLGADESEVAFLAFKAYLDRWEQNRQGEAKALEELAAAVAERLPGTDVPIEKADASLLARFARSPVATYKTAGSGSRRRLHRALWVQIKEAALLAASRHPADPGKLAAEAERLLPERPGLANRLRLEAVQRQAQAERLSREQVLTLARQYRLLERPDDAEALVLAWLAQQRSQLQPGDAEGRIALADEYLQLARPPETQPASEARRVAAKQLLLEAWQLAALPAVGQRLEALDLRFQKSRGAWIPRSDYEQSPEGQRDRSIQRGQIQVGMTADEVLQSRGRRPERVTRVATFGRAEEQWVYGAAGSVRLFVNLERPAQAGVLRVVSFYLYP